MTFQDIQYIFNSIFSYKLIKSMLAGVMTVMIFIYGNNHLFFQSLAVLIIVDLFTGLLKAKKIKEDITSFKLIKTGYKVMIYGFVVAGAHQMTNISNLFIWFEQFVFMFLGITEMISIIENLKPCGLNTTDWVSEKFKDFLKRRD